MEDLLLFRVDPRLCLSLGGIGIAENNVVGL